MKAYVVFEKPDPYTTGCSLVFAETPSQAKYLGMLGMPFVGIEYHVMRARRAPEYDKYADDKKVILTNDELPEEAPPFFLEDSAV
jgi:hypothetical protein